MDSHFSENSHSSLNHEVVNSLGVLVARPHYPLVLQASVDELLCCSTKNISKESAIENDVKIYPVPLGVYPDL